MKDETPYDRLPYTDHAYAESHPNRLAVVARLSGWVAPELAAARILEIGCARGGNLLPMAMSLPGAALVGIDPSQRQVDEALRIAGEAQLPNVRVLHTGFETAELEPGSFDYVLCHGLYSWIAVESRRALLRAIGQWLAPGGVAYVSFNTLPGWYERMAAKDWLRRAPSDEALASLGWLREQVSPELATYRYGLSRVLERLHETDPAYLVHEYLSEEHHPEYVGTFLAEAAEAGLAYLGDAIPQNVALELLPDDVGARVRELEVATTQETIDFVKGTSFRRALLVRAEACAERGWRWPKRLDPAAIGSLRIASRLREESPGSDFFRGARESVQVPDPAARAALRELQRVAPRSLAFQELPGADPALASELFDVWLATGELDLYAHAPPMAQSAGEHPEAPPLVRLQAAHAGDATITNLWHQEVRLLEPLVRFVLARLDGTRTAPQLVREAERAGLLADEASVRIAMDLLAASALLSR
ncbi:class I SAM-dependent methyltransferase [Pendulispora brunnea]|uniref:Class I SAM-dependent methyltransferase n=1 Tax=Pendulispora brunnea TaxID=2905690 RepID=A0ABZ2K9H6_9BACT